MTKIYIRTTDGTFHENVEEDDTVAVSGHSYHIFRAPELPTEVDSIIVVGYRDGSRGVYQRAYGGPDRSWRVVGNGALVSDDLLRKLFAQPHVISWKAV